MTSGQALGSAVVVGGSLGGLTAAVALARRGVTVTVLERYANPRPGGAGLGVDLDLLADVTGADPRAGGPTGRGVPTIRSSRDSTSWTLLQGWLYAVAAATPGVALYDDVAIARVEQDAGEARAVDAAGRAYAADVVIGADGYRSATRATAVAPERPNAVYAGYVLWRGLMREADLPPGGPWADARVGIGVLRARTFRLVAYPVPGPDGSVVPGRRQISWAWYDPGRTELLRDLGALDGRTVLGSVPPDQLPPDLVVELAETAHRCWPSPWRGAIAASIDGGGAFATPIAEYVPERLARGRVAVLGDAAHVASPMTGQGFHAALLDAQALGTAAAGGVAGDRAAPALAGYERARLRADQALVLSGHRWGESYLAESRTPTASYASYT